MNGFYRWAAALVLSIGLLFGLEGAAYAQMSEADTAAIAEMRTTMLAKKFYLVITRPAAPQSEIDKLLYQHLQNQVALEKQGIMFAAGPVTDLDGTHVYGMFVIRATSAEEARQIADNDPMHKAGVKTYDLYEWTVNEGRVNLSVDFSTSTYTFE